MNEKISLRIASAIMLLHTIGHSFGALNWKKAPNAQIGNIINAMQNTHFQFMGRQASLGDFYQGYGISMIFVLLLVAVLLWQLSGNRQAGQLAALTIFLLLLAVTEYVYFFPFAAAFSFLACICTAVGLLKKKVSPRKAPA